MGHLSFADTVPIIWQYLENQRKYTSPCKYYHSVTGDTGFYRMLLDKGKQKPVESNSLQVALKDNSMSGVI